MRLALKSYIKGYNQPSLHGEDEVGRTLEEGLEIARRLEAYGYDCLSVDFGQYDSFYYAAPPCYMEKGRVIPPVRGGEGAGEDPHPLRRPDERPRPGRPGHRRGEDGRRGPGPGLPGRPRLPPEGGHGLSPGHPALHRVQPGVHRGPENRPAHRLRRESPGRPGGQLLPHTPPRKKSVLVVGGGPCRHGGRPRRRPPGAQGHPVGAGDALGGNLIPAGTHDFKRELHELSAWYQRQLAQLGVAVRLGTAADAPAIRREKPDAVILAVGATPTVPPAAGMDSPKVVDCVTALTGADLPGQRILVVGGGLVGCETALGYAQAGEDRHHRGRPCRTSSPPASRCRR